MAKEPFFKIIFRKASVKADAAWDHYTKIYGAWMLNVFSDQRKAKEKFLYALDFLQKNLPKSAIQILDTELKSSCKTTEEKTVWLFFMGIAHETMEQYAKALLYFISASEYEHENPVIHQKLAACAYRESLFGLSEYHYQEAIRLMIKEQNHDRSVLAISYASLSSCLTMMHKYKEAEEALLCAESMALKTQEEQKAKILLHIARREYEQAESALKNISENRALQQQLDSIRANTNEQFCTIDVENSEVKAFWRWFANRLDTYLTVLDAGQPEAIAQMTSEISIRLKKVFPFTQRTIRISAYKDATYSFFISDFYARALSDGLKNLFAEIPEQIKENVRWIIIH